MPLADDHQMDTEYELGEAGLDKVKLHNGKGKTEPVLCRGLNRPVKVKPLGERRKAVWRQELMVLLGNTGVLGAGMGVALPSVTLDQLTNEQEPFHLSIEEASWFCKHLISLFHPFTSTLFIVFPFLQIMNSFYQHYGMSFGRSFGRLFIRSNWTQEHYSLQRYSGRLRVDIAGHLSLAQYTKRHSYSNAHSSFYLR